MTEYFIILAKIPGFDIEDFGDLVLKMKNKKEREITCFTTVEENYDYLFNSLIEQAKKEDLRRLIP